MMKRNRTKWTMESAKEDNVNACKKKVSCRVCKYARVTYIDPICEIKGEDVYMFQGLTARFCKYFENKYKEEK